MMGWIYSLMTGQERPNQRETRVRAATRMVERAKSELTAEIKRDRATVRGAIEELLIVRGTDDD